MPTSDPARILITGATGFVGQHLCGILKDAGHDVHAVVFDGSPTPAGVSVHAADVADAAAMAVIGRHVRPEVVFHLAALHGRSAEEAAAPEPDRTNVEGVRATLAATQDARRFVFLSSAAVIAGRGRYARSKADAEQVLDQARREGTRDIVTLRASTFFGPGDRSDRLIPYVMRSLAQGRPAHLTTGTTERDYVFVQDAVALLAQAGLQTGSAPTGTMDLCSGTRHTVRDMANRAAQAIAPDRMDLLAFGERAQGAHEAAALPQTPDLLAAWLVPAPGHSLDEALARTAAWIRRDVGVGAA